MSDYLKNVSFKDYNQADKPSMKHFFIKEFNEIKNYFKKDNDITDELKSLKWGGDFNELYEKLLKNLHIEQMITLTNYINENASLSFKIRFNKAKNDSFSKTFESLASTDLTNVIWCFDGPCTV